MSLAEVDQKKLIELMIRGGWPGGVKLPVEQAALLPAEYLNAVIGDDVYRINGVERNTAKMGLLRSLARNESTGLLLFSASCVVWQMRLTGDRMVRL